MPTTLSSRGRRVKKVNYSETRSRTTSQDPSDNDEDMPIAAAPPPKRKKKTKTAKPKTSSKRKRRLETPPPLIPISNDNNGNESSDDDCVILNIPSNPPSDSLPPPKKRRLSQHHAPPTTTSGMLDLASESDDSEDSDEYSDEDMMIAPKKTKKTKKVTPKKKKKKTKKPPPEKRSARFRGSCPQKTRERIARARNQRLFMINATIENDLCRSYAVLGSTGNVYDVIIAKSPQCSCPDFGKGNLCKHILFVMLKVLRVNSTSPHVYQRGLLSTELREIFANAPDTLIGSGVVANNTVRTNYAQATGEEVDVEPEKEVVRKEVVGNDCPVCMEEFEEGDEPNLVWCQAQCGQNIHTQCFDMWADNARGKGEEVSCVYCRAKWIENAGRKKKAKKASTNVKFNEGYMNLGSSQGLSSSRDTSSYHSRYDGGWGYGRRYGRRRNNWW